MGSVYIHIHTHTYIYTHCVCIVCIHVYRRVSVYKKQCQYKMLLISDDLPVVYFFFIFLCIFAAFSTINVSFLKSELADYTE